MFYKLDKNTIINTDQISVLEKVEINYPTPLKPTSKNGDFIYRLNLVGVIGEIEISKQQYETLSAILLEQKQLNKSTPKQIARIK